MLLISNFDVSESYPVKIVPKALELQKFSKKITLKGSGMS